MMENAMSRWHEEYFALLEKLAQFPFDERPSFDEIGMERSQLQSIYGAIQVANFPGTILDFLCLVSTGKILKIISEKVSLRSIYEENKVDFLNMMRLFWKNPQYLLAGIEDKKEAYKTITEIRYDMIFS